MNAFLFADNRDGCNPIIRHQPSVSVGLSQNASIRSGALAHLKPGAIQVLMPSITMSVANIFLRVAGHSSQMLSSDVVPGYDIEVREHGCLALDAFRGHKDADVVQLLKLTIASPVRVLAA